MFYALIAVMVCARVIGSIADLVVDIQSSKVYEAKLRKTIKANDILRMDEDDDGEVDKLEFLKIYLTRLGKVDKARLSPRQVAGLNPICAALIRYLRIYLLFESM